MPKVTRPANVDLWIATCSALLLAGACSRGAPALAAGDGKAPPAASKPAGMEFVTASITDPYQGDMVIGTFQVPKGWKVERRVVWNPRDVSLAVRVSARFSAPDGSAWLEWYPAEVFYWLEPEGWNRGLKPGARSLGIIFAPRIGPRAALLRYVVAQNRGQVKGLQVVGARPIRNLVEALGKPAEPGDSMAARVRYTQDGHPVEEEFFAHLGVPVRIPYTGPQGTTYEIHRPLTFVHSMGARDGQLDRLHPVLGFTMASFQSNPAWVKRVNEVYAQLAKGFNQQLAQQYAQIRAAGERSRAISAQNDAFIAGMDARRQATNQADAQRRSAAAASAAGGGGESGQPSMDFDHYVRGTEVMQDPYWGTSEQSYLDKFHWTDGSGNYQHSNDPGFDPNQHSTQKWQRMEPVK